MNQQSSETNMDKKIEALLKEGRQRAKKGCKAQIMLKLIVRRRYTRNSD